MMIVAASVARVTIGERSSDKQMSITDDANGVELATRLAVAWLSNPSTHISGDELLSLIRNISELLDTPHIGGGCPVEIDKRHKIRAVSVELSLSNPDYIISLINGKPYKSLRRHLANNNMTPEEYREAFDLEPHYPMVAPNYSKARRLIAKKIGLGCGSKNPVLPKSS